MPGSRIAHIKSIKRAEKGFINLQLTRRQAEEWINVLSVGLVEDHGNVLAFAIHSETPVMVCRRGSCEGKAQGQFAAVIRKA